jgi:hypothetical protein
MEMLDLTLQMLPNNKAGHELNQEPRHMVEWSDRQSRLYTSGTIAVEDLKRADHQYVCLVEAVGMAERPRRRELENDVAIDVGSCGQL